MTFKKENSLFEELKKILLTVGFNPFLCMY